MTAWFGSWHCNCTDVESERLAVPEHCPDHGFALLGPVEAIQGYDGDYGVEPPRVVFDSSADRA